MAAYLAVAARRKNISRERRDPMLLPDELFIKEYRITKDMFKELCSMVEPRLRRKTRRSNALTVEFQVLLCLKLLASGRFQNIVKNYINVAQPTVSVVLDNFLNALGEKAPDHIFMPMNLMATEEQFNACARFPHVVGTLDCTHIPIIAPGKKEHLYVSKKGFHSVNIQAICDNDMVFTDVVAKWPGSTPDSFIVQQSNICERFESGEFGHSVLLGDNGYPLKPWLMTPFLNPSTPAEEAYNKAHKETHATIQRAFRVLKQRFRILDHTGGSLCYSPLKTCKIFVCCAILHNMCRRRNIPLLLDSTVTHSESEHAKDERGEEQQQQTSTTASAKRTAIAQMIAGHSSGHE